MWSFGVLYYRLVAGFFPFDSAMKSKKDLFNKILFKEILYHEGMDLKDVMILKTILKRKGKNRAKFESVIEELELLI